MAFLHYLRYDSVEIVNSARLDAYVDSMNLGFFTCEHICPTLTEALEAQEWKGEADYTNPKDDNAPWYDPVAPYSAGFAGVHVLDGQEAMTSSTWVAETNEALADGGFVSPGRSRTREMTFRALLMGTDQLAVQYGFDWFSTILHRGNVCQAEEDAHTYRDLLRLWSYYKDEANILQDDDYYQAPLVTGDPHTYAGVRASLQKREPVAPFSIDDFVECDGQRTEFFVRCPTAADVKDVYRYFLDVHCTQGPIVLNQHEVADNCGGGAWMEVEFTLVAANPYAYRYGVDLANRLLQMRYSDFMPGDGKNWWAMYKNTLPGLTDDNVYEAPLLTPTLPHSYSGLMEALWRKLPAEQLAALAAPSATASGNMGIMWTDPDCPIPRVYPSAPEEELMCRPPYKGPWNRLTYRSSSRSLYKYNEAALLMEFTSLKNDLRDVRVRLVRETADGPDDYDVQLYIQYLPNDTIMRIDGRRRDISLYWGDPRTTSFAYGPASHLVTMDTAAGIYRFPVIACGGMYKVVVDTPTGVDAKDLRVSVKAIGREN